MRLTTDNSLGRDIMANLLFSPSGRIGPAAFLKGIGIIAAIGAVITVVPMFSLSLGTTLSFVSILLLIPLFMLVIKRLHDSGKSGWLSILFVILIGIIAAVLQSVASNMFGGSAMAEMKAATEELTTSGASFGEIMAATQELAVEYGPAIAKNTAIPSAIAGFLGTMGGAFLVNLILKQDAHENQYGHPPAA